MAPVQEALSRSTRFLMLSVATTIELSPSVYEGRKLSPKTSTVTRAAKRALSRPVTGDSGIDRSPVSGVAPCR